MVIVVLESTQKIFSRIKLVQSKNTVENTKRLKAERIKNVFGEKISSQRGRGTRQSSEWRMERHSEAKILQNNKR